MTAFQGEIVTFLGRLEALPRGLAARAVLAAGGGVRRALTRRVSLCVVGHGASRDIDQLDVRLGAAARRGAALLSENQFLRKLDVMPPPKPDQRSFTASDIISRSGIAPEDLRLLVLFDIVEPSEHEGFGLRDLIIAKSVRRLLTGGLTIADIVRVLAAEGRLLHCLPPNLFGDAAGRVAVRLGAAVSEIGGQLRLPLPTGDERSVEALFEAAESAEDLGAWPEAERLYRRCIERDRRHPIAAFNLGNVLCRLGREREGRLWLQHAVGLDPGFAEAWYNLGLIAKAAGDRQAACRHFEQAIAADPNFADAMFNLAALCFAAGDHAAAQLFWRRYLEYDAQSAWANRARCGLALCRQLTSSLGRNCGEHAPAKETPQPHGW
jgi:hypothetical protein